MTRWLDPHPVEIPASFSTLNLSPLIAQTLLRRGISSPAEVEAFLHPDATPPAQFPNIENAVNRILLAIRNKDLICVWGDFDVDGQTSAALLVQALRSLGADVIYYIPIRGKESHGVHVATLAPIIDNGAKLIVTCDTGITANEAVDFANSRGVDVVITDHHDLGETLPNAFAIVNPKLLKKNHPLANLAGVGVAYKLAEALLGQRSKVEGQIPLEDLLDLVALGLIADIALLKNETRSLAQKGIQKLRDTKRLGLKVIAELSSTSLETLTEETIGFTFAPRLNALGRLGDANPAVELLLTNDSARARVLAAQIEGLNSQRRLLTSQVYEAAESQLKANPELLEEPAIVLSHPGWPGGVVGIVANKLVDRYHKPAILFNETDGVLRGSARSVEGLHITEAIATQKDILHGFGGHPMAAGMALNADNLTEFRRGLGRAIEEQLGKVVFEEPTLQIDAWLGLSELHLDLAESLEGLAPFGAGNPSLTLATRKLKLKSVSTIGKTKEHLRLNVEDESGNVQSVLWWGGAGEVMPEGIFDLAYSFRATTFRGQKQLSIVFEEFRVTPDAEQPIEVRRSKLEIRDLRMESGKFNALQANVLVWAEGSEKAKGISRFNLKQADEFAIYTTPPSPVELQKALEIVNPKVVTVFAVPPAEEKPEEFLSRLAGLCKFALNKWDGKTTVHELAAAMASRESAVQIGLDWLAAGGQLTVEMDEDQLNISASKLEKNPYLQLELFIALRGVLSETSAFRKFFSTTNDLQGLLK